MANNVVRVPRRKQKEIEKIAEAILKKKYSDAWEGKTPIPVDRILEDLEDDFGFSVIFTDLKKIGLLNVVGYTDTEKKVVMIHGDLADSTHQKIHRYFRSTVGHEIGHAILHSDLNQWKKFLQEAGVGLHRSSEGLSCDEDPEWQAWCFCHALCMPAHLVKNLVQQFGTRGKGIQKLMEVFNMNYSFVLSRLRSLKLMPLDRRQSIKRQKYVRNPKIKGI